MWSCSHFIPNRDNGRYYYVNHRCIARFVFNSPFTWTEELARYIFVYITFLGGGLLVYQRSHLFVEVVFNVLPLAVKKIVQTIIDLIVGSFSAFLIYSSYLLLIINSISFLPKSPCSFR